MRGNWFELQNNPSKLQTTSRFCFLPYNQKSGIVNSTINTGTFDTQTNSYLPGMTKVTLVTYIENVNDRPVISKTTLTLPRPLPYNLSDITGAGFRISEILTPSVVSDPDQDRIGMSYFRKQY